MEENTNISAEVTSQESVQDGAVQAAESGNVMAMSDFMGDGAEGETSTESAPQEAQETSEEPAEQPMSGGIKGRLMDSERKGYERGKTEAMSSWEAEKSKMQADYLAAMQQLNEYKVAEKAEQIAKEEGCSIGLATRLARMELGMPQQSEAPQSQPQQNTPQRDPATGRFVKNEQPTADDRAQFLYDQAQTIKRATGFDVLELFSSNPEVQQAVSSGAKDFADIAKEYAQPAKRTPAPVRSSGDGQVVARSFKDMTDEQFDALQDKLRKGYVVDTRR